MKSNLPEPRRRIVEPELSYRVVNAFFEVYNALGFGYLEPVYSRALEIALVKRNIRVSREVLIEVFFEGHPVGRHRLDMLVENRIVLELKSTELLSRAAQRQVRSYLAAANLELGIILHFGPVATFHRVLAKKSLTDVRIRSARAT